MGDKGDNEYCAKKDEVCEPDDLIRDCCGGLSCQPIPSVSGTMHVTEFAYRCTADKEKIENYLPCHMNRDCKSGMCDKPTCPLYDVVRDRCGNYPGMCVPPSSDINRVRDFDGRN
jgi:hypothetical protein